MENKKTGVEIIAEERKRQVEKEGWTADHDAEHDKGELAVAAACYAVYHTDASVEYPRDVENGWPWAQYYWRPSDSIRNLAKAGALIAAEIDRIQNRTHDPH